MYAYIWEMSKNSYTRGKEHLASLDNREERSRTLRNSKERHDSNIRKFQLQFCISVTGQFKNDAMLRHIYKAARINRVDKNNVLNAKNKWNCYRVPQVTME